MSITSVIKMQYCGLCISTADDPGKRKTASTQGTRKEWFKLEDPTGADDAGNKKSKIFSKSENNLMTRMRSLSNQLGMCRSANRAKGSNHSLCEKVKSATPVKKSFRGNSLGLNRKVTPEVQNIAGSEKEESRQIVDKTRTEHNGYSGVTADSVRKHQKRSLSRIDSGGPSIRGNFSHVVSSNKPEQVHSRGSNVSPPNQIYSNKDISHQQTQGVTNSDTSQQLASATSTVLTPSVSQGANESLYWSTEYMVGPSEKSYKKLTPQNQEVLETFADDATPPTSTYVGTTPKQIRDIQTRTRYWFDDSLASRR